MDIIYNNQPHAHTNAPTHTHRCQRTEKSRENKQKWRVEASRCVVSEVITTIVTPIELYDVVRISIVRRESNQIIYLNPTNYIQNFALIGRYINNRLTNNK